MWYASTCNTCVFCSDCAVENWRYASVPLNSLFTNGSPLCAFPTPPQFFNPTGVHTHLQPTPPRTAYARGCGAEAAARVGAWASLGCTQCKAAGDWPSSEGKGNPTLSGLRRVRAACPRRGSKMFVSRSGVGQRALQPEVESPQRLQQEVRGVYHVLHLLQSVHQPKQWQWQPSAHVFAMHLVRTCISNQCM